MFLTKTAKGQFFPPVRGSAPRPGKKIAFFITVSVIGDAKKSIKAKQRTKTATNLNHKIYPSHKR